MGWHGQELLLGGTIASGYSTLGAVYGKGWVRRMIHHEPVVALSLMFAGIGLAMPLTIVPLRRALGFNTNQYDAFQRKDGYNAPQYK